MDRSIGYWRLQITFRDYRSVHWFPIRSIYTLNKRMSKNIHISNTNIYITFLEKEVATVELLVLKCAK